jgi:23S rRNA (adenine2503-C2)-methyltransferase
MQDEAQLMKNIFGLTRPKLEQSLIELNEKPFRATQIFEWIYKKGISDFTQMSNISKTSMEILSQNFTSTSLEVETMQMSKDGTRKFLFRLQDGNFIETVLMRHNYGNSVCISTQVGCNMGCSFCASGINKRKRNLEVEEMVLQVVLINDILRKEELNVSHVVIMGIGEPFDNYDNVMDFIKIINDGKGLEIGARHITVSTCGIAPKIIEFSNLDLQVNLAISLHFPNDELRSKYMLINKAHNLDELFTAIRYYYEKTNRRLTFEYILLDGINDTPECCNQLIKLIRNVNCYVNLIPMNESNQVFKRSKPEVMNKFYDTLVKAGINVTLRREQGHDIDAACGQLRIKREGMNEGVNNQSN